MCSSLFVNGLLSFVCRCLIVVLMMFVLLLKFMFYMSLVMVVFDSILLLCCVSMLSSWNFCVVRLSCVLLWVVWWLIRLMCRLLIEISVDFCMWVWCVSVCSCLISLRNENGLVR